MEDGGNRGTEGRTVRMEGWSVGMDGRDGW